MLTALRTLCVAACIAAFAAPACADSWAAPQVREVFSASRDHFVRVIPGNSVGDTIGFAGAAEGGIAGAAKGAYASAEFYRRQPDRSYRLMATAALLNPVAPVEFFVSNDGRLATIDNWHNRGFGSVVAVYDPQGKLVKAYALTDLFSKAEIDTTAHSVSSRAWHNGPVYINQDQRTLYLMIASGRDLVLGLTTGRFAICERRGGKDLCRSGNKDRRWVAYAKAVPNE